MIEIKSWVTDATLRTVKANSLRVADLRVADLRVADLRGADLSGADLRVADLRGADLRGADLRGADLRDANLSGANLSGANLPHFQICPQEGSFIAYKSVVGAILTLEIQADAQRTSSLVGRKCRASAVRVVAASDDSTAWPSKHDNSFIYRLGEIARVADFDDDIRVECTSGLHFWMTRREAEEWRS